ncbi:LCP family protein [Tumebacillus permanentifrigoris]|uniref:LytR family transcriptional attenuator n=1 Tax=Tumebacillus permanentifrigoris TaxID=378543 RepID=A0A316DHX2_9BACL|nr:LCP family protein [Tumebacillus permanentifrigoris]PWK16213.1 LytR family transcriptional attenuator [Tumebacillus permanentifrigoris]
MAYQGKNYSNNANAVRPQQQTPQKPKKKLRWGRFLLLLFVFTLVMGLTGLAAYGWYLERKVVQADANATPIPKDKPVNVLIIGVDRDPKSSDANRRSTFNTDTLILAHIDPSTHRAALLSIPRDTRVQLPTGMEKVNAAYAIGGMDRLKKTVNELTGLPIDRYLMIDFPAFMQMIDGVGGLEFDVDKPISDPEGTVSLKPGLQHLNGKQALTVVRFRQEEMGDIARVARQQRFLEALGTKMKGSNLVEWTKALRGMSDSLTTDMSINDMGTLAYSMHGEGATVNGYTVPGEFLNLYDVSYWKADTKKLQTIVQEMKN